MKLANVLIILMTTSARARSSTHKRSTFRMQNPGSTEEVLLSDAYSDKSDADDTVSNFNDEVLCSFSGEYPDIEFQQPNDVPDIIDVVDDLTRNCEFALLEITSSIENHIEVLQETIDYIFEDTIAIHNKAVLDFSQKAMQELLSETDKIEANILKYISKHLLHGMSAVQLNMTSNVSQASMLVAKYVLEVTTSLIQQTDQIIAVFFSLNDLGKFEDISSQGPQFEQAIDTAVFQLDLTAVLSAQENIEIVFSYIQEAVEIGTILLNAYLDESMLAVSERIIISEIFSNPDEEIYILDYTFREQITLLQDLLSEAVSTALHAIVETVYNFVATIKVEILVAVESVKWPFIDTEELNLKYDYVDNFFIKSTDVSE